MLYDAEEEKYHGPTHDCWTVIRELLEPSGGTITEKHLYTIVIQNRYKIAENFDRNLKETHSLDISLDESCSVENDVNECNDDSLPSNDMFDTINFDISLCYLDWKEFVCTTKYADKEQLLKNYTILKPFEWTNTIYNHFYAITRLPCCLTFKRNKVTPSGGRFLKFEAKCSTCNSTLNGMTYAEPPVESPLVINCIYTGNFKNCPNSKKRRLMGTQRDE